MNCEHCHGDRAPCPVCGGREPFTPEELRAQIENHKRDRLTATQLADQLKMEELTAAAIAHYAKTGEIPCKWIEGEAYFDPESATHWLRYLLKRAG